MLNKKLALGCVVAALGCATSASRSAEPTSRGVTEPQPKGDPTAEARHRQWFQTNVIRATRDNDAYRRVVFTGARSQLALMAIPVGSDIGVETHRNVEQILFIASGEGKAVVQDVESPVVAGDVVILTPGVKHDIVNTGSEPLRIYTVYAPPNHIDARVQQTKADAEADKEDEAFGRSVR